ncbi:hypothetical protein LCGC14_0919800 [marine sediment metagenome]|uniref:Uncharacterized protein n=1 Tax=marine sediment metagenome TaxID=412755 RepID=A0A0F9NR72_9ZZZZ
MELLTYGVFIGIVLGAMLHRTVFEIRLEYQKGRRAGHGVAFVNCDHCKVRERFRGQYSLIGHTGGPLLCEDCMTVWHKKRQAPHLVPKAPGK